MAAGGVVLGKCADAPVKYQELFTQTAPHRQQRLQGIAQETTALGNLLHLLLESAAAAFPFAQHNPEGLQRTADLVHHIGAHADQLGADTEHGTGRVAFQAFDPDFPIPPHPDNLRQSLGIVLVGLVDLKAEGSLSMPGVEADNGQAHCLQPMPVQVESGPLSSPTRTTFGALVSMALAIASGVEAHWPHQTVFPLLSMTHRWVVCWDTSRPTYCSIA